MGWGLSSFRLRLTKGGQWDKAKDENDDKHQKRSTVTRTSVSWTTSSWRQLISHPLWMHLCDKLVHCSPKLDVTDCPEMALTPLVILHQKSHAVDKCHPQMTCVILHGPPPRRDMTFAHPCKAGIVEVLCVV